MKKIILSISLLSSLGLYGQTKSYTTQIQEHRNNYKKDFITDERSPLTANDTAYLRFYDVNAAYKVVAHIKPTPDSEPFDIPTANGKTKKYRQYGVLTFNVNDTLVQLQVFQSLKLLKMKKYKNHLFVPFTDATTYVETYGGGRYLDLELTDIKNNKITLDFNKCYNPWCAFGEGYSCPIPPKENRLNVAIKAGEKQYAKSHH